jgi:hypothetical protein
MLAVRTLHTVPTAIDPDIGRLDAGLKGVERKEKVHDKGREGKRTKRIEQPKPIPNLTFRLNRMYLSWLDQQLDRRSAGSRILVLRYTFAKTGTPSPPSDHIRRI